MSKENIDMAQSSPRPSIPHTPNRGIAMQMPSAFCSPPPSCDAPFLGIPSYNFLTKKKFFLSFFSIEAQED